MRRLLILLMLTTTAQAASEIRAFLPGVSTTYAMVREIDGDVWYVSGQVFEAWGTGARTAADYDIAMVDKSGDMFVGTMDSNISAGTYYVTVSNQAGAAPADTDPVLWYDYADWSGTVLDIDNHGDIDAILADTDELQTDWTNGGRLDLLIDAIKAITDRLPLLTTTVASVTDASNFVLTAGTDVNDIYAGCTMTMLDATDGHYESRMIETWSDGARACKVNIDFGFTPAPADSVWIWAVGYTPLDLYEIIGRMPYSTTVIDATGQSQQNPTNVIKYRTYPR